MRLKIWAIFVALFSICATVALSDPSGPTAYSVGASQRRNMSLDAPANISAVAGNITELVFNATSVTKAWQGYFGNITGKITLDDARNWTLYDWNYANPSGRVYAARINSVNWANIGCMRYSTNGSLYPNRTTEEAYLGMTATDADGIVQTFGISNHPALTIGTVTLSANTCNSTYMYVNDTAQTSNFREVLLTDNSSNNSVIYTAILESNVNNGFNNKSMNFEMIVGQNGHTGGPTSTPYYFWVELI